MTRAPAVAGQFYPGRKDALEEMLLQMMPEEESRKPVIGIMSPHAGYVYSGAVAGETISGIVVPEQVIILGPNHHGHGHPAAVYARGAWETPLGEVPIAEDLARLILQECPFAAEDMLAHRYEHSLEVQIPFLQKVSPRLSIVPICLGHLPLNVLLGLGDGLARSISANRVRPLIVASTDMTHYEPGKTAREKDFLALEKVLALDPSGLYQVVQQKRISMCGVLPVVVMLQAALGLGATESELVDYRNSGDVTGDQSEVVGYAGVRFF
jgi:AmmeMemoRadiSam system protein B